MNKRAPMSGKQDKPSPYRFLRYETPRGHQCPGRPLRPHDGLQRCHHVEGAGTSRFWFTLGQHLAGLELIVLGVLWWGYNWARWLFIAKQVWDSALLAMTISPDHGLHLSQTRGPYRRHSDFRLHRGIPLHAARPGLVPQQM
jgi:hypothetical protein